MYTVYTATMANAHWPLAPIGQWASAMVAYTSDTHWVKALQCYTAIQRYIQRAVEYTAIHRYTLYTLYNTPLLIVHGTPSNLAEYARAASTGDATDGHACEACALF